MRPTLDPTQPFLSACIMCKDEQRFLPRCLESLRGVVDEIIFVDTGSTDRSIEIAQEHGAKIHHFAWIDDFSAARNETLRLASGRWVLIIDCDEYLTGTLAQPGMLKQELLTYEEDRGDQHWPACFVKIALIDKDAHETGSFGMHKQLRLWPNDPGIHYEMPIHNRLTLDPKFKNRGCVLELNIETLHLVHRGYDPEVAKDKKKSERAFRILQKALEKSPDTLNYFYLGREHYHCENWKEAVVNLNIAKEMVKKTNSPLERHHLQAIYYYLVTSMHRCGTDLETIRQDLIDALQACPESPDLWFEAGCIWMERGELEGSMNAFRRAEELLPLAEANASSFLMHRPWGLYFNAGRVETMMGEEERAREWFQKAIESGMPDGPALQDLLDNKPVQGRVCAGVATIPSREAHFHLMLQSILPQVDELHVYLNNYTSVPEWLLAADPKVRIWTSDEFGDLRDTGKFWGMGQSQSWDYYFSLDDDICYPSNYVHRLVQKIEQYDRKAVVGVHGSRMRWPVKSYIKDRDVLHCLYALEQDEEVDVLGTGTAAFHRDTFGLYLGNFAEHGMTDIWFSLAAQREGLKRVAIERRDGWLTVLEVQSGTLYEEAVQDDSAQTRAINLMEKSH